MEQTISLRIPTDLLEKVDAEAEQRKRPRAFIVREKLENSYPTNGTTPQPAAKKSRKKEQTA
jgi:predicted transcriptional regulator